MIKFPKPSLCTARQAWFVQLDSRRINRSSARDAAFRQYHEIMGQPPEHATPPAASSRSNLSVIRFPEILRSFFIIHIWSGTDRLDQVGHQTNLLPCAQRRLFQRIDIGVHSQRPRVASQIVPKILDWIQFR